MGVGPQLVEKLPAGLQNGSEQVPGVVGRQGDEQQVEAVEHLPSGQDVAEGQVGQDSNEGHDRLQDSLNPIGKKLA